MDNSKKIECSGLFIHFFIESIHQLNIFPQPFLTIKASEFDVGAWYAIGKLSQIMQSLAQIAPIAQHGYFQAGVKLAHILKQQFSQAKTIAPHDWLNANVRNINCCALQAHDTQAGTTFYQCSTCLPPQYIKGYLYGCYTLSYDENVDIESDESISNAELDAPQNPPQSFNIFVRYVANKNANLLNIKHQFQADYLQEISQLLNNSLTKQIENSAIIARLNAEIIEQRDRIARLANHDPVTGLASLRLGRDRLRMACNTAKRNNVKAAVMLIDLDGFKQANAQYGHVVGDVILKTVADRISKNIRATDSAVRQSGDSFLIILSMFNEVQSLGIVAKRVILAISQPIEYEALTLNIACNIGIAVYPDDTDAAEQMIKCADKAIRTIKKPLNNQIVFHKCVIL